MGRHEQMSVKKVRRVRMKRPEKTVTSSPGIREQLVQHQVRRLSLEDKILRLVRRYRAAERRRRKREVGIERRVVSSGVPRAEREHGYSAWARRKWGSGRD
jgi:hypothetical protein